MSTVKAKGTLKIDDKPFGGVLLVLTPVAAADASGAKKPVDPKAPVPPTARANVKADGSFVLTTYDDGDGAVPGKYTVSITQDMSDMSKMSSGVPVVKAATIEIASSATDNLEVKLESTGETASGPMAMLKMER